MKHWLIALLLLALIPYGVVCFFALPFGDDFCFGWTATENISFLQKFLNQYLYWNGRYTSDVLINLHPILTGKLWVIQTVLLVSLLSMPVALYVLLAQLIDSRRGALTVSLITTLFYLCYMPQITEGVYWYGGIVNYHLGNVVVVLHVAAVLRVSFRRGDAELVSASSNGTESPKQVWDDKSVLWRVLCRVSCAVLLVLAIGFNEIAAVLLPAVYLFATLYTLRTRHPLHKTYFYLLLVAVIAACFVVFAPGNMVRAETANGEHKLFYSAGYALVQTARFTAKWLFNYPAPALLLLLVLYANEWKPKLRLQLNWPITAALAFVVLFLSAFIPYYATGMLGQHRTINYAMFFTVPLFGYTVLQLAVQYNLSQYIPPLKSNTLKAFVTATVVIAFLFTGNGLLIVKDFAQGYFTTYKTEFTGRELAVKKGVPPYSLTTVPATFRIIDAADSTDWVGTCMENYYLHHSLE